MDYIQSKVEEILYNYVGIEKPKKEEKQNGSLEIDTALLPTDLEQVSPDSDKKSSCSVKEEVEEEIAEDFESPAFEPIEPMKVEKTEQENSQNTNLSEISGLTSQDSAKSHKSDEPTNIEEQNKVDTALSQISSTQDNIPDTTETEPPSVTSVLNVSGICGEEAQMATGLNDSTENEVKPVEVKSEKSIDEPKCQFDLKKDLIEFTGTERKSINLDDSTNSGESEKVIQSQDVQSMEVENLYENDTTDSSEMRMEIDLKDESTQGTAASLKIEESSQDSSKVKDSKKHHKRERSRDRSKSSSHKSSRHHHSSSSMKSKNDETSRHKSSHSSAVKGSSSSHKKSSERDKSSSSRKDHRDKDRKSDSSKSRPKNEEPKATDDHHQEKSSSKKRRSTNDSSDSKDNNKPKTEPSTPTKSVEKIKTEQTASDQKDGNGNNSKTVSNSNKNTEHKSSILIKYDYLKSPCRAVKTVEDIKKLEQEKLNGFHGFEQEVMPENPWFECLTLMQSKKFPFVSNNNYISKKSEITVVSKKSKAKAADGKIFNGHK